jgi:hypothetical protein
MRALFGPLALVDIASPSYDDVAPFDWTNQTCGMLHLGQPDRWEFPWFAFV